MTALPAKIKNDNLLTSEIKKHLFEDPPVLWGIEEGLPDNGKLPFKKRQEELIKGAIKEWTDQVTAWIDGGMKYY